jgi:Ca2+:H+ antiporter
MEITKTHLLTLGFSIQLLVVFVLLFAIIALAFRVSYHAEMLAEQLGEPYGTLILTSAAVTVEVVILVMMMMHEPNPTLARDTVYAALMIDINGIIGLAAIVGGIKHGEQSYNVESGNSYLSMILIAVGLSMALPVVIPMQYALQFSLFSICAMVILYGLFLKLQTGRHSYFFDYSEHSISLEDDTNQTVSNQEHHSQESNIKHIVWLIASIVLIGALAELMAVFLDQTLARSTMHIPKMVPAILVALISASPEILTAIRAALDNRMQAAINIGLGASLATVVLTIPVIEIIALLQGHSISMALTPVQMGMILITLFISSINLHNGETNTIEGYTYAALFSTFIFLSTLGL